METEEGSSRHQGGNASGADRISDLPDDLLHDILLRLPCMIAALTAILSRHVWAHIPELELRYFRPKLPGSCATSIDGALASCSAPTLRRLVIRADDHNLDQEGLTAAHAAPWLRFASQRVAGELMLWLPMRMHENQREEQDLELPVCAAARRITIRLRGNFKLRPLPPPADGGAFKALTFLQIEYGRMDGRELGDLVSSAQCPCLEELNLTTRLAAGDSSDVTICSGSLKRLDFHVNDTHRLVVIAPMLEKLCASKAAEAYIAAPKLVEIKHTSDMPRYELPEAGRHFHRLETRLIFPLMPEIMQRFNTIGELIVHPYVPFSGSCECLSDCWYFPWPESSRDKNFTLDSLEEIEIHGFWGKDQQLECVRQLLRCNSPLLKQLIFRLSPRGLRKYKDIIQEKIRCLVRPGTMLMARLESRKYSGILEELHFC
ncbi:hypothetical protein EJB05_11919, partial [Eragrostis curvula]